MVQQHVNHIIPRRVDCGLDRGLGVVSALGDRSDLTDNSTARSSYSILAERRRAATRARWRCCASRWTSLGVSRGQVQWPGFALRVGFRNVGIPTFLWGVRCSIGLVVVDGVELLLLEGRVVVLHAAPVSLATFHHSACSRNTLSTLPTAGGDPKVSVRQLLRHAASNAIGFGFAAKFLRSAFGYKRSAGDADGKLATSNKTCSLAARRVICQCMWRLRK